MQTPEEPERCDFEEAIVSQELPDFRRITSPSGLAFTGDVTPVTGNRTYGLGLDAKGFPYEKPDLCVVRPQILWIYGGAQTLNSLGASHDYHTWSNGPHGVVRICHTAGWDPSMSIAQVLLKGIIWLEAYSIHLHTGATIARIIDLFDVYFTCWRDPLFLRVAKRSWGDTETT